MVVVRRSAAKMDKLVGWRGVEAGFTDMTLLLEKMEKSLPCRSFSVIASTIPGKAVMQLPEQLFKGSPVVFDASYIPYNTPLIHAAKLAGCKHIVRGLDMLIYQGYMQNEIFTGMKADRKAIKDAVSRHYFERYVD